MSNKAYSTVEAARARMVFFSLIASGVIGGIAAAFLGYFSVLTVAVVTAFFCSLLCVGIFQRLMSEIRSDQLLLQARLVPEPGLSSAHMHSDGIAALYRGEIIPELYEDTIIYD